MTFYSDKIFFFLGLMDTGGGSDDLNEDLVPWRLCNNCFDVVMDHGHGVPMRPCRIFHMTLAVTIQMTL